MSDVTTFPTTVTVAKGSSPNRDQIGAAAIAGLKDQGKVPQNCLPWAEIDVDKTEADKSKSSQDRVYHVNVSFRDLNEGETVTADDVIASMITPPSFDPDEVEPEHS